MSTALSEARTPDSTAVTAELWISFVSLMRSHLAALQTTGRLGQVMLVETTTSSFRMGDLALNLEVALHLSTGAGRYQLQSCGEVLERGSWMIYPNATASIHNDRALDMELLMEAFARKLSSGLQRENPSQGEKRQ